MQLGCQQYRNAYLGLNKVNSEIRSAEIEIAILEDEIKKIEEQVDQQSESAHRMVRYSPFLGTCMKHKQWSDV